MNDVLRQEKKFLIYADQFYKYSNKLSKVLPYHEHNNITLFTEKMVEYFDNYIETMFRNKRDVDIANAVNEVFRRHDRIEEFNKKSIYIMVREISNCKTQQITKIINKMIHQYKKLYKEWINTGDIDTTFYRIKKENNMSQKENVLV